MIAEAAVFAKYTDEKGAVEKEMGKEYGYGGTATTKQRGRESERDIIYSSYRTNRLQFFPRSGKIKLCTLDGIKWVN